MTEPTANARALIEHIAKAIVEDKAAVFLDEYEDGDETVIELEVAEAELGKIIGRSGRIARALRTVLAAAGTKTTSATLWRFSNSGTGYSMTTRAASGSRWRWLKTQGRRGEVAVESHTDVPDRFQQGMRLWALLKNGERREVKIEDLWPHKSLLVLKFAGVDTINDAERAERR